MVNTSSGPDIGPSLNYELELSITISLYVVMVIMEMEFIVTVSYIIFTRCKPYKNVQKLKATLDYFSQPSALIVMRPEYA